MSSLTDERTRANGSTPLIYSPADLAQREGMKCHQANGKTEWHGATPGGGSKTKDGFILFEDGRSWERGGQHYTSAETARIFGIEPEEYEPVATYRAQRPQEPANTPPKPKPPKDAKPVRSKVFDYPNRDGTLLFQTVRREYSNGAKTFSQRRPDGSGGWIWKLEGVTPVLYNLPQVLAASIVHIFEGESCADAFNAALDEAELLGEHYATTAPMGAGAPWHDTYSANLEGKQSILYPDNDDPGRKHRDKAAPSIAQHAASLKVIELPDLPEAGDVVDFFKAGGTLEQALDLCKATPDWELLVPSVPVSDIVTPKAQRFRFVTLEELAARPAPEMLIDGLLVCGKTSLLTAKHANFKTFKTISMALSVASGLDWHGCAVKQGVAVYAAGEGASGLSNRSRAWCIDHEVEFPRDFYIIDEPVQIADPAVLSAFIEEVAALSPALIVLDTLARCAVGLDENSSKDMGFFVEAMSTLAARTGAHVMAVHHNNKNGEYRGSSALTGAVDTHISIERREGGSVTLTTEKQKDFEEAAPMLFSQRVVELDSKSSITSLVFDLNEDRATYSRFTLSATEQKVFDELVEGFGEEGATAAQWEKVCEQAGITRRTFFRAKTKLLKLKIVHGPEGEKPKRGARFTPSPDWCQSVPNGDNDTNGTEPVDKCHSVPPPFRGGTDGTNRHQSGEGEVDTLEGATLEGGEVLV